MGPYTGISSSRERYPSNPSLLTIGTETIVLCQVILGSIILVEFHLFSFVFNIKINSKILVEIRNEHHTTDLSRVRIFIFYVTTNVQLLVHNLKRNCIEKDMRSLLHLSKHCVISAPKWISRVELRVPFVKLKGRSYWPLAIAHLRISRL